MVTDSWPGRFKGEEIPQTRLQEIWMRQYSSQPFPNVKGYVLRPKRFLKWIQELRASGHAASRELEEYGDIAPINKTCAFVISPTDGQYLIFRSSASYYIEEEDLKHELGHIFRGEVDDVEKLKNRKD